jgi:crotonobetainyl-CoA:carnitine CoA-transferase CaiB-like acyl-CoA transferase
MRLLSGIRVLDLTNVLAGPFAGYQLALFGADVVKVEESKGGDLARQLGADPDLSDARIGASFLAQNAGKRSITVNLKSDEGKRVFERLLAEADVLIENFRPGVMERLGYGWEAMRGINPRLVYCAISGFGQSGPLRDRPAYDQIIQGLSGMMSVTGSAESAPTRVGFPICDVLGGVSAAWAVVAALLRRERTGAGCMLDVSMLETAITALGWVTSDYLIAGREPRPMGNENATSAPSGTFETGDGELNIAANKQEQFEILCRLLDREELLTDARFATREARKQHRLPLKEELERSLRAHAAEHWEKLFSAAGVPAARVLSVPEALASDHVTLRHLVHELPYPDGREGVLRVLGSGIHVDGRPVAPGSRPALLGEHTEEILRELGFDDAEVTELRKEGAV